MVREIDARAIDALIALVLTVAALGTLIARGGAATGFRPDDPLGTVLVLLQTVPLVLRRVAPLGVLAVVSGAVGTGAAFRADRCPSTGDVATTATTATARTRATNRTRR